MLDLLLTSEGIFGGLTLSAFNTYFMHEDEQTYIFSVIFTTKLKQITVIH